MKLSLLLLLLLAGCTRVIDGDTLVLDGERVRIWGIDAPEIGQPYGFESKRCLERFARMPLRLSNRGVDAYGRVLGSLTAPNGQDVARGLVLDGCAWDSRYERMYQDEEREAREARRGLWNKPNSVNPGEWRRR